MKPASASFISNPMPAFRRAAAALAVFAWLAPSPGGGALAAGNMFQYDAQHSGRSAYVGPQSSTIRCRFSLGGKGAGSPVFGSDGTIYIPSGTREADTLVGYLYAVNPDCTQKWVYQLPGPPSATAPAIASDGTIYVHTNGGEGNVVAIERLTAITAQGALKWEFKFNGGAGIVAGSVQSSPAIGSDGIIYVGSKDTYLYALNPDGSIKWAVSPTISSIDSSPAIGPGGDIYVMDATCALFAFAAADGRQLWSYQLSSSTCYSASPAVAQDGTVYIGGPFEETLTAVNSNGSLKCTFATGWRITATPAIATDGTVYVGSDGLYALNPDCSLKWKFPSSTVLFSSASPVIGADGNIYWREGFSAYAVDSTGKQVWKMSVDPSSSSGLEPSAAIGPAGVLAWGDGGFTAANTLMVMYERAQLSLAANNSSFRRGQALALNAAVSPGPASLTADVYIALQFPGCGSLACALYWQGGLNFTATQQPYVRDWRVASVNEPIFDYVFDGTEPAGNYVWYGALTEPGTLNLIGSIKQAPFTFSP